MHAPVIPLLGFNLRAILGSSPRLAWDAIHERDTIAPAKRDFDHGAKIEWYEGLSRRTRDNSWLAASRQFAWTRNPFVDTTGFRIISQRISIFRKGLTLSFPMQRVCWICIHSLIIMKVIQITDISLLLIIGEFLISCTIHIFWEWILC